MAAEIFTSNAAQLIFELAFMVWIVSEIVVVMVLPLIRRGGVGVSRKNRFSNLLIMIDWMVLLTVASAFGKNDVGLLPFWAFYLGIGVMLLGVAFRQWSIFVLGKYFSGIIGVQADHKVVDTGPYRYIRHPSYTGALILQIGMGLAFQSWAAVLVIVVCFGIFYGHRILVEEKVLANELGEEYTSYMKRTKRLIPFLI